jgi:uncharacterized membrane protein (DUF485 family)
MKSDDNDLRLDRKARSFRVSNFSWRDIPLLLLAFVIVALPGLIMGWLPGRIVPETWRWVFPVILVFVAFVLSVYSWFRKPSPAIHYHLSPEVRALAGDPLNLAAAIMRFREEHPEVSLVQAKQRIEEFSRTGR